MNLTSRKIGFTLIEVMIALVIITLALTTGFFALMQATHVTSSYENQVHVHLVAMEKLIEYELMMGNNQENNSTVNDSVMRFNRKWDYTITTQKLEHQIMQINIQVRLANNHQIKTNLTGSTYDVSTATE